MRGVLPRVAPGLARQHHAMAAVRRAVINGVPCLARGQAEAMREGRPPLEQQGQGEQPRQ
jgi:hypothetical protein